MGELIFGILKLGNLCLIYSTPLGELFDHGLDSMAAWLINLAVMSMFGIGEHSINIQEFLFLYFVVLSGFYSAHWEKYNTGVLYLPWAYDASQLVSHF